MDLWALAVFAFDLNLTMLRNAHDNRKVFSTFFTLVLIDGHTHLLRLLVNYNSLLSSFNPTNTVNLNVAGRGLVSEARLGRSGTFFLGRFVKFSEFRGCRNYVFATQGLTN